MAVRFVPKKNVYRYYERTDTAEKLEDRKHEAFVREISTMVEDMLVGVCTVYDWYWNPGECLSAFSSI